MAKFRREHLAVDETIIDESGAEVPLRIVEPEDISFGAETIACHFANGESILVRRSEIATLGVNPYRNTLMFIGDDGYSISVPEDADDKEAVRWFNRGK